MITRGYEGLIGGGRKPQPQGQQERILTIWASDTEVIIRRSRKAEGTKIYGIPGEAEERLTTLTRSDVIRRFGTRTLLYPPLGYWAYEITEEEAVELRAANAQELERRAASRPAKKTTPETWLEDGEEGFVEVTEQPDGAQKRRNVG